MIGDSVNPWMLTRDAWRDAGLRAGAAVLEVETICSDPAEHRRRIDTRVVDVAGLQLPDWQAVTGRDYHRWTRARLEIDTARLSVVEAVATIRVAMARVDRDNQSA